VVETVKDVQLGPVKPSHTADLQILPHGSVIDGGSHSIVGSVSTAAYLVNHVAEDGGTVKGKEGLAGETGRGGPGLEDYHYAFHYRATSHTADH
jgi:hypothetical protein